MCVIVYKKENQPLLSEKEIRKGFSSNGDGAGFAWKKDGIIHFRKGLMSVEKAIEAMQYIPQDAEVMYHFRITTHGGTSKELTHPFIISPKSKELFKTEGILNKGKIASHNGIFSVAQKDIPEGHSDTSYVFGSYLAYGKPIPEKMLGYSKVIIFDVEGETEVLNENLWQKDKDGRLHSNYSITGYSSNYRNAYGYSRPYSSAYDDYEDYYDEPCSSCIGMTYWEKQNMITTFNKMKQNDKLRILTGEATIYEFLEDKKQHALLY